MLFRSGAYGGWRRSTVEMNSIPWSPILRYATPLPINRTPVSTVGGPTQVHFLRLRYARPLQMNRIPFRTCLVEHKAVSSVLRYARPRFHRLFRPSPPDEHDHAFHSDPAGWLAMNTMTTLFLRSDPAMYTSPGCTYICASRRSRPCTYARMRVH